ncbi:hypothetical protein B296_00019658 [Ensete ventricosum]|uniref:Uncharacterized protein n=1 Tax=Ensete ventricosum TaxID=4639 RepID=A0A427B2C0_ENSVE|nr:hypothetical protein B296_00019658 [Ensete ventricosum]
MHDRGLGLRRRCCARVERKAAGAMQNRQRQGDDSDDDRRIGRQWWQFCMRWLQDLSGVTVETDSGIATETSRIAALLLEDGNP